MQSDIIAKQQSKFYIAAIARAAFRFEQLEEAAFLSKAQATFSGTLALPGEKWHRSQHQSHKLLHREIKNKFELRANIQK